MSTVLITGGSGLIGKALTKALLEKNYEVIILTRKIRDTNFSFRDNENVDTDLVSTIPHPTSCISYAEWNIEKQTVDENAISEADYIIHLAGANLGDKRWTKTRKQEIVRSRVESSKLIVNSLKKIPNKVRAVVSASAIGYYGPDLITKTSEGKGFQENDAHSEDFLGITCNQWEESISPVSQIGKRLVIFRTGIVLTKNGGALKEFLKPLRFGIATILGNGNQIISWIHINDLVRMYINAIENENMSGVYNAVAPVPVSNRNFVLTLAKTRKNFFIPVGIPSFILKIVLGEMSIEVLKSATVSSQKIEKTGFNFLHPNIQSAFQQLFHPNPQKS